MIKRRKTRTISLGKVKIGGNNPISVQSMTKTDTKDIASTVKEINSLDDAGCEIIRIAVKDEASASSLSDIKKRVSIPIEADIHFNYKLALLSIAAGVDGIRLNPGNIYKAEQVKEVIKAARAKRIPIRIGVNSGSLRAENRGQVYAMVKAVLDYLKLFEKENFRDIMISLKASDVVTTIEAYRRMAKLCDYPLHLGVTATGSGDEGLIKSSIGIGTLLAEGIGDTIRVSLTACPENEVIAGRNILQSLGIRKFAPDVISCPTCGRCQVDLMKIANRLKREVRCTKCDVRNKDITIAIMGCEVNGPGEAKEADIGIAFGKDSGVIFKKGKIVKKVKVEDAVKELLKACI